MNKPEPHETWWGSPALRPLINRRAFLSVVGTGTGLSVAGCLGSRGESSTETVAEDERLENHPSAAGLSEQPTKGPDPASADAVIIAFEDPSCTRCRAFERDTIPMIESELVDPGRAAFVFRGYPVIYEWGGPATHALEATFAWDEEAFWALKDLYFSQQSTFDAGDVLNRTREFLDQDTEVDGSTVIEAVEAGETESAVQSDLDAGMNAGAGRTTPHVFLFRDGRYRTKAAGSVSFSVVKNALGL